jgi:hypothetical protein
MKLARILLLSTFVLPALPAAAAEEQGPGFGHMLTLMQVFVRLAGSDDPASGLKAMDDVLAGRNLEANQAAFGLFNEMTAGMPAEHRAKVASIAGDVLSLARRDLGKQPASLASAPALSTEGSLQARKDLNAMGLRYFDAKDYLDAVKRGDELAVELFIAGRGVNLASRDADGRSATEIARAGGNPRLAELLARNLPAAR